MGVMVTPIATVAIGGVSSGFVAALSTVTPMSEGLCFSKGALSKAGFSVSVSCSHDVHWANLPGGLIALQRGSRMLLWRVVLL